MAIESVDANPGTGGAKFATDDISGGKTVPYAKLMSGTDASEELIGGDAANGLDVDVTRSALPAGASTSAKQDTGNTSLSSIDGKITAVNTGAVVVSSSALPTGASTSAKQDTGNTSLASIDGKITAVNTGAVVLAAGAATIGALTANQSVNMAQVGGTNTVTAGVNGTQAVGGNVATNVAIGTNPINLGAQAISSENTAVTATRMAQLVTDLVGKLIVLPYANPENFVSGAITSAMTGTTSTSLLAAPAAGLRNYITQITISNAHATVGTDVIIQDGNGGTTLYTIPAAAVYGGATVHFPVPLRQPTTATAIYCANVTTGASTKVSASGYKGI